MIHALRCELMLTVQRDGDDSVGHRQSILFINTFKARYQKQYRSVLFS